jgi:hypothetical protein
MNNSVIKENKLGGFCFRFVSAFRTSSGWGIYLEELLNRPEPTAKLSNSIGLSPSS